MQQGNILGEGKWADETESIFQLVAGRILLLLLPRASFQSLQERSQKSDSLLFIDRFTFWLSCRMTCRVTWLGGMHCRGRLVSSAAPYLKSLSPMFSKSFSSPYALPSPLLSGPGADWWGGGCVNGPLHFEWCFTTCANYLA